MNGIRGVVAALSTLGMLTPALAATPVGEGGFACRAAETSGLPEADTANAVTIVCDALAKKGGAGAYRVSVGPLGSSIVFIVTDETNRATRSILVPDLEETPTAARRLAEALVEGRDIEQTERLGDLLPAETRRMREKQGSLKLALGATGFSALGQDTGSGAGGSLGLVYDTPTVSLYGELLGAGSSNRDKGAGLFSMEAGARYSFSQGPIAPYLGAGAGLLHVGLDRGWSNGGFQGDKTSFAPHLEAGIQVLRLHRSRLSLGARVYLPLTSVPGENYEIMGRTPRSTPAERYVVPVVFGINFAFGG